MTAAKEQLDDDAVRELTEKAIDVEISKLARMMATRSKTITELQAEIKGYGARITALRRAKIAKIEAQIPAEAE